MEKYDWIQERNRYSAVIRNKSEISNFIQNSKDLLLNKPRIPNVIHLSKEYETFGWRIIEKVDKGKVGDEIMENKAEFVMVLMKEAYVIQSEDVKDLYLVEIALNLRFYSHSELIKMLTPINLKFSAYEIIGDIVHLNLTDLQQQYKQTIADIIYFKTGKTVINKTGKIEDTYRFYKSEVLAGPNKLTTIHKENDVKIFLDLGKVYWCSRLQTERIRILKMIKKDEVVCDPFCGVGPHVIPALKKGAKILCNDLNPAAIECLKKSLELNKLECDCVENIDAGEFLHKHNENLIDHVILNLPEHSLEYIHFMEQYEGNFCLHVFFFCKASMNVIAYIESVTGYKARKEWLREVRKVSPSKSVYKLEVKSREFFAYQNSKSV